ncbi:hypothetical protein D3C75_988950 [compost metagenome]
MIKPATVLDKVSASRIEANNGPTEVIGDRMVKEIRIMPITIVHPEVEDSVDSFGKEPLVAILPMLPCILMNGLLLQLK